MRSQEARARTFTHTHVDTQKSGIFRFRYTTTSLITREHTTLITQFASPINRTVQVEGEKFVAQFTILRKPFLKLRVQQYRPPWIREFRFELQSVLVLIVRGTVGINMERASKCLLLLFFLCSTSLSLTAAQWGVDDTGCRTPGRGVGDCVNIDVCTPMLDFLSKIENKPIDVRTRQFLRGFRCGYNEFGVKVCCPAGRIEPEWAIDDNGCRTPDRGVGDCIDIYDCGPVMDLIKKVSGNLTPKIKSLLRSYQCGQTSGGPKVCCPNKPILIDVTSTPVDPENHPNADLLQQTKCGEISNIDRIINGNKTRLFEFPWMATLKYQTSKGPDFRCGGTLISKRYVLTAAHCVRTKSISLIGVRLGEYDLTKDEDCEKNPLGTVCAPPVQDFDVTAADAIVHPKYNSTPISDDIALIRLNRDADVSVNSVNTVCLPIQPVARDNKFKKKLIVTGWGATETGYSSPVLLQVRVPVIPNDVCSENYKNTIQISDKQLCAGGKNAQDSCAGDSGGPLMETLSFNGVLKTVQYGVVSFGPKLCAQENFPGVYTRITSYLDWILDNIKP